MKTAPAKAGACIAGSIAAWLLFSGFVRAQAPDLQRVLNNPKFQSAEDFIDKDHDRIISETIQITEIEAPPFKEEKRGTAYLEMLRQAGLVNVEMDAEAT